ncbi:hypothetical protein N2152v2_004254 [Parachlorella kessleri]
MVIASKESYEWLRDYVTAIRSGRWHPFTPTERKARAATRNQPWGPTGTELNELADMTQSPVDASIIFAVLELRLGYPADKWRNVYKALTVLEFLVKRGSEGCVQRARDDFLPKLEDLGRFEYTSPDGRDMGLNVRHRAQAIAALLKDPRRLSSEREAFKKRGGLGSSSKYQGYTRDQMQYQGAGAGSNGYSAYGETSGWHQQQREGEGSLATPESSYQEGERESASSATSPDRGNGLSPEYRHRSPESALRNAGETKGVSMQENARYLAALRKLLDRPGNRACADCKEGGAGSRPSWASINTGVFICMRCAGIHRGLGVHVSKVRSCTLDTWLPGQVAFMAHTGNAVANKYWEARAGDQAKPAYSNLAELDAFIRRKYINRDFVDSNSCWPPSEEFEDDEIRAILREMQLSSNSRGRGDMAVQLAVPSPASGSRQPSAAGEGSPAPAQQTQPAAPAPAASPLLVINLMDLDLDPTPSRSSDSAATGASDPARDPLRDLEQVFAAATTLGAGTPAPATGGSMHNMAGAPGAAATDDPFAASVAWEQGLQGRNSGDAPGGSAPAAHGGTNGHVVDEQQGGSAYGNATPIAPRPGYNPPWASTPPPPHVGAPAGAAAVASQRSLAGPSASGVAAFEAGFEQLQGQFSPQQTPPAQQAGALRLALPGSMSPTPQPALSNGHARHYAGSPTPAAAHTQPQRQATPAPRLPQLQLPSYSTPDGLYVQQRTQQYHPQQQGGMGRQNRDLPAGALAGWADAAPSPHEAKLQSMLIDGLSGFTSQAERVTAVKHSQATAGRPATPSGPATVGMAALKAAKQQQGTQQKITASSASSAFSQPVGPS